ncbi:MAG: PadR family transcriptional regulator [Chordicoccus sp.]|jgi:PadR family transcriptional regulator PadR
MGISSDVIRGCNDIIILDLLLDTPSYGYEISQNIRKKTDGAYVIKETTLYSAVTRLEKEGYLKSYPGVSENGKRRTYYMVTDSGKEYYAERCREWKLTRTVVDLFVREMEK